jgi:hypothetical protein
MPSPRLVLLLVALTFPLSGSLICGSPNPIASITPARNEVITDSSFNVVVELGPTAIASTLTAALNGQALALSGGPTLFTATLNPGPPLLDDNELVVTVGSTGKFAVTSRRSFQYLPPKARRGGSPTPPT